MRMHRILLWVGLSLVFGASTALGAKRQSRQTNQCGRLGGVGYRCQAGRGGLAARQQNIRARRLDFCR